jgi:hypothetical protein
MIEEAAVCNVLLLLKGRTTLEEKCRDLLTWDSWKFRGPSDRYNTVNEPVQWAGSHIDTKSAKLHNFRANAFPQIQNYCIPANNLQI